ncbi:hypothetical protein PCYB_005500, partial [Plasmodium cynomolgi strain B]
KNEYVAKFYESTCDSIIRNTVNDTSKYNDFCMKLIRNLGAYSTDPEIIKPSVERCDNLQSWLCYLIRKYNISIDFIQTCFEESKLPNGVCVNNNICPYYPYKEFINIADDMLKIKIFVDNISTIRNILMDKAHIYNCSVRMFLYECLKIYMKIKDDYCSHAESSNTINICSELVEFEFYYDSYIYYLNEIPKKLKFLNAEDIQFTINCSLNETMRKSVADKFEAADLSILPQDNIISELTTEENRTEFVSSLNEVTDGGIVAEKSTRGDINDTADHSTYSTVGIVENQGSLKTHLVSTAVVTIPDGDHSTGSSVQSGTTTALGTGTAVSSALFLLYKV